MSSYGGAEGKKLWKNKQGTVKKGTQDTYSKYAYKTRTWLSPALGIIVSFYCCWTLATISPVRPSSSGNVLVTCILNSLPELSNMASVILMKPYEIVINMDEKDRIYGNTYNKSLLYISFRKTVTIW